MRTALVLLALTLLPAVAAAQGPGAAPYQRMRHGGGDWHARGGHHQSWRGGSGGYGGFYDPYFYAPPIVTGSWYQRPYPYHFDYYRHRWGAPPASYGDYDSDPGYAPPDCPCAVPPQVEVIP